MEQEKTLTIPMTTAICAARHIVGAHESAVTEKPVDFGGICSDVYLAACSAPCRLPGHCCLDWIGLLKPLFDATGIWPQLGRDRSEFEDEDSSSD